MRHFSDYAAHGRPARLEAMIEIKPRLGRGGALLILVGALFHAGSLVRSCDRR